MVQITLESQLTMDAEMVHELIVISPDILTPGITMRCYLTEHKDSILMLFVTLGIWSPISTSQYTVKLSEQGYSLTPIPESKAILDFMVEATQKFTERWSQQNIRDMQHMTLVKLAGEF